MMKYHFECDLHSIEECLEHFKRPMNINKIDPEKLKNFWNLNKLLKKEKNISGIHIMDLHRF